MPVTPYHFGPALVLKAFLKKNFSMLSFGISQVLIDLEAFFYLVNGLYPIHRFFHTFLGALFPMILSFYIAKVLSVKFKVEYTFRALFFGSAFGGINQVFLDSIMHSDMKPFFPFLNSNYFLNLISVTTLHNICLYSGIIGLFYILITTLIELKTRSQ